MIPVKDQHGQVIGYRDPQTGQFYPTSGTGAVTAAQPSTFTPTTQADFQNPQEQGLLNYGAPAAQGSPTPTPGGMGGMESLLGAGLAGAGSGAGAAGTGGRKSDFEAGAEGAISGAATGMAVGGPPGAAVGAVAGGAMGAFGNEGKSESERMQERMLKIQMKQMEDDFVRGQRQKKTKGAESLARSILAPFIGVT